MLRWKMLIAVLCCLLSLQMYGCGAEPPAAEVPDIEMPETTPISVQIIYTGSDPAVQQVAEWIRALLNEYPTAVETPSGNADCDVLFWGYDGGYDVPSETAMQELQQYDLSDTVVIPFSTTTEHSGAASSAQLADLLPQDCTVLAPCVIYAPDMQENGNAELRICFEGNKVYQYLM